MAQVTGDVGCYSIRVRVVRAHLDHTGVLSIQSLPGRAARVWFDPDMPRDPDTRDWSNGRESNADQDEGQAEEPL
ncbi:hypothetical protein BFS79_05585 [Cutibacterium avidum]|nr:hypothetical protein BFS79_05585 [Cutibacterium avidum]